MNEHIRKEIEDVKDLIVQLETQIKNKCRVDELSKDYVAVLKRRLEELRTQEFGDVHTGR
jgi:hypothetical protein